MADQAARVQVTTIASSSAFTRRLAHRIASLVPEAFVEHYKPDEYFPGVHSCWYILTRRVTTKTILGLIPWQSSEKITHAQVSEGFYGSAFDKAEVGICSWTPGLAGKIRDICASVTLPEHNLPITFEIQDRAGQYAAQ